MTERDKLVAVLEELGVRYSKVPKGLDEPEKQAYIHAADNSTVLLPVQKEVIVDGSAFMFDGEERYLGQRWRHHDEQLVSLREEVDVVPG